MIAKRSSLNCNTVAEVAVLQNNWIKAEAWKNINDEKIKKRKLEHVDDDDDNIINRSGQQEMINLSMIDDSGDGDDEHQFQVDEDVERDSF